MIPSLAQRNRFSSSCLPVPSKRSSRFGDISITNAPTATDNLLPTGMRKPQQRFQLFPSGFGSGELRTQNSPKSDQMNGLLNFTFFAFWKKKSGIDIESIKQSFPNFTATHQEMFLGKEPEEKTKNLQITSSNVENFDSEDEFHDCFQNIPIGKAVLSKNQDLIKSIVNQQLQQLAAQQSTSKIAQYGFKRHSYKAQIDQIQDKAKDDIERLGQAMQGAQLKHKKIIEQRNKEIQDRTTTALVISCAVIAACLLPVAGLPLFAAFAFGGVAGAAVFTGISLVSQLGGWILRKSVLEPTFFNKLKDKLNHKHVCPRSTSDINNSTKDATLAVKKFFRCQKEAFLQNSDKFFASLKILTNDTFIYEFEKALDGLPAQEFKSIQQSGASKACLEKLVIDALDKTLRHEQAEQEAFIQRLKHATSLASFYPADIFNAEAITSDPVSEASDVTSETSDATSEASSAISQGNKHAYFEKQLWARYILDHNIGLDCKLSWYQSTLYRLFGLSSLFGRKLQVPGVLESSITNRLFELGVIETKPQKNWFRPPKLIPEELQKVHSWAQDIQYSFNDKFSIFNNSLFVGLWTDLSVNSDW